jgi:hypothetical protein
MKPFLVTALVLTILLASCHRTPITNTPQAADTVAAGIAYSTRDTIDIYAVTNEDSLLDSEVQKLFARDLAKADDYAFTDSLEIPGSVLGRIQTNIRAGLLFDNKNRFALVKQVSGNGVNIRVFKKGHDGYSEVLDYGISEIEFTGDTLKDVNNDGYNDLLLYTYGSSGCCLKAFCEVHLYKPDGNGFAKPVNLANPTFSPDEKVVRGVYYGYSGEPPVYKYQWNGIRYHRNSNAPPRKEAPLHHTALSGERPQAPDCKNTPGRI